VRCLGSTRLTVTPVPAIAPATRKVPASIRSGMMSCSAPCNSLTPSTMILRVPAPSIFAPILLRKSARSHTSGSCAAPSITVVPSARTAAIMMLSVPRTVGPNLPRKLMTVPVNFGAKTFTLPLSTRARHLIQRVHRHSAQLGVGAQHRLFEQEQDGVGLRKLRRVAEAPVLGVVGGADRVEDLVDKALLEVARAARDTGGGAFARFEHAARDIGLIGAVVVRHLH